MEANTTLPTLSQQQPPAVLPTTSPQAKSKPDWSALIPAVQTEAKATPTHAQTQPQPVNHRPSVTATTTTKKAKLTPPKKILAPSPLSHQNAIEPFSKQKVLDSIVEEQQALTAQQEALETPSEPAQATPGNTKTKATAGDPRLLQPTVMEATPHELFEQARQAQDTDADDPDMIYNQPDSPYAETRNLATIPVAPGANRIDPAELLMYRSFTQHPYLKYDKKIATLRGTLHKALEYMSSIPSGQEPSLQRLAAFHAKASLELSTFDREMGSPPKDYETYKLMKVAIDEMEALVKFWREKEIVKRQYRGTQEETAIDDRILVQRINHIKNLLDKVEVIAKNNQTLSNPVLPYNDN